MKITTKIGDRGSTSLLFGGCDKKDSLRIECCGALDELCSFLGLAKSFAKKKESKVIIENIQGDLFIAGAEMATEKLFIHRLTRRIGSKEIKRLEAVIADLERKYAPKGHYFILPGENTISAVLDVTRTIARRAERKAVALRSKKTLKNSDIIIYLNRLSDLLFLMARTYERPEK